MRVVASCLALAAIRGGKGEKDSLGDGGLDWSATEGSPIGMESPAHRPGRRSTVEKGRKGGGSELRKKESAHERIWRRAPDQTIVRFPKRAKRIENCGGGDWRTAVGGPDRDNLHVGSGGVAWRLERRRKSLGDKGGSTGRA